ncbi:MAG: alpha-amylase family glycosyl hydrolase, partial [Bacteroidota bacterium]
MRLLINLFILSVLVSACSSSGQQESDYSLIEMNEKFPERAKSMNIYEVNIRQYTPEGTINAFVSHLPRLQAMGVDILWLMPIQPIGEKNRKGPLGSYYSIQDYTAVNPNSGTTEDFKNMVDEAHERGMLVILDWVANHSAFDHEWAQIDGYHTVDSAGNVTWPEDTDWTDVADLNYDNMNMRADMIEELKWWVTEMDIDGFRCDVAGFVPMDFWNVAKDSLDQIKDLFMLAEWDEPKMHDDAFHMTYAWGPHHWMNETAKGHFNVDSLEALIQGDIDRYGASPYRMMFTTNHDENSWNGTVFERFGEGHKAYAVWAFTVRGMPLIYSGQESGLDKRLRFFDKDTIDFSDVKYQEFYTKLLALKHENEALFNGEYGGGLSFIEDNNSSVSSFRRSTGNNIVTVVVNLSDKEQTVTFDEG